MTAFEWKPVYSVGDEDIDGQHKALIGLMNDYYTCHLNGNLPQARSNLAQLLALTVKHFREEEEMMERTAFPSFLEHRRVHQELLKSVEGLVREYLHSNSPETAGKLANFLKVWLTRHILGSDKKYGPYLKKKTTTAAPKAAA